MNMTIPCRWMRVAHALTRRPDQAGSALIISLLMMLLITLLGLSMMRSVGLDTRMTANTGEKQHAFQTAQTALQYGEWWLAQADNATTGVNCTGLLQAPLVCANPVSQSAMVNGSWANLGAAYAPPSVNGANALVTSASGGSGTYFAAPQIYIAYLGASAANQAKLYQVTAVGYGGNANAVSVVQSTYSVSSVIRDLGGQ